uniref:V-set and immunoglobulin domain-containing protein 1 n=1 Tax=Leptobrachium leishanense TaxID=445787 RepID=A0A8C5WIU8_9ANUR
MLFLSHYCSFFRSSFHSFSLALSFALFSLSRYCFLSLFLSLLLGLSLFFLFHCSVCLSQVTMPVRAVNATVGQNVTLQCTYSPAESITDNLVIQWSVVEATSQHTNYVSTVYYFQNGKPHSSGRFVNRVIGTNTPGNASITIFNLEPQDTGTYTCEVMNSPSPLSNGIVHLTVQVAPSTPHCTMRGAMETGHYLSLYCLSEVGMPLPTYTWNRVVNGELKPIPAQINQQSAILIIGNMSKFDDGYYRCTASNNLGNASCELDLHTGGGIIGAVLVAAIIFAIVWFLIVKKKSKKQTPAKEVKTLRMTVPGETHEPARENLVSSEPTETIEFHDHAGNVAAANGEMENPSM